MRAFLSMSAMRAIVGVVLGGFIAMSASAADQAVPATVGTVTSQDMPIYLRGLGTVQAFNTVTVKSRVDGQIMQVLFQEGQEVKAGDKLFQIDPRPYQAALDQATAAKAKDAASLHSAQLDLGRSAALVGNGFQTRQLYDQQQATVAEDQALIASDQAQIDTATLNLAYADVRAPIDGRTGARLVDQGNLVQAASATSLVTITQLRPIFVSFTLPQDQLDEIRRNQAAAALTVDAYASDDQTRLGEGKLTLIDNTIDQTTGTIHLKASFDNSDERLWPGEFVNARLVLSVRKNIPTVPAQTVMQGATGPYIFVVADDNMVHRRDVTVAATQDGVAAISKGVAAGEKVVTDGQYRLTEGAKIAPSGNRPANPPAG